MGLSIHQQRSLDRKTKICCTVGPNTAKKDKMHELLNAGMNIMRLNCSHGTHEYYQECIATLRQCVKENMESHVVDFSDGAREGKLLNGRSL